MGVQANTNKLVELGFKCMYGAEEVLDGSVECAKRWGVLSCTLLYASGILFCNLIAQASE